MNQTETPEQKKRGRKAEQFVKLSIKDLLTINSQITPINAMGHLELIDNTQKVPRSRDEMLKFLEEQDDKYVLQPDDRFTTEGTIVHFHDLLVNGKPNPKLDKDQVAELPLNKLVNAATEEFGNQLREKLLAMAQPA